MTTVGEALIEALEAQGVEVVFGIPGVHTVELYRGLAKSKIRHITPRHEQGAGFMADGYARASGKPGVCFLITGPGLTNAITAMAQAKQDSIPMLVISGVNARDSLGKKTGRLHELDDQHALMRQLIPHSFSLRKPDDLVEAIEKAFTLFASERPVPVHIEVPLDLMPEPFTGTIPPRAASNPPQAPMEEWQALADRIAQAKAPLILAGGGVCKAANELLSVAEKMGAPVISTTNARAALGNHPLHAPVSATFDTVRRHIAEADLVLAVGTELGQTDYDVFADGGFPEIPNFVRIDIDAEQLDKGMPAALALHSDAKQGLSTLADILPGRTDNSAEQRSEDIRSQTLENCPADWKADLDVLDSIIAALPDCTIVGDSTQVVYSGNMIHRGPLPAGWFNAATGYGTLGYAPPAAIGASLADPDHPVVCLVGDGGFQFSMPELGAAVDAGTPVIFLIWNNFGFREIEKFMVENEIEPVGVKPTPPDFQILAQAYGIPSVRVGSLPELEKALRNAWSSGKPSVIEMQDQP